MRTPEEIQYKLREMLTQSIELQASKSEEEEWRTAGMKGAILQGRINTLDEVLKWIEGGHMN